MATTVIPSVASNEFDERGKMVALPEENRPSNVIPMSPPGKTPEPTTNIINGGQDEEEVNTRQFSFYDGEALSVDWTDNAYANLAWIAEQDNLAKHMEDGSREYMGSELLRLMAEDESTRTKWVAAADLGMRLCDEVDESGINEDGERTDSVPKFPMLVQAVVEFAGRAQETLLSDPLIAKCEITGDDTPRSIELGHKASISLSSTIRGGASNWDEDTDRKMHVLGATGTTFRKWIFDKATGQCRSEFLLGQNVIVNNAIKCIEEAPRISEPFTLFPHIVKRHMASGHFVDFPLDMEDLISDPHRAIGLVEVHLWIDVDGDGQDEPYIATIHRASQQVVRLEASFTKDGFSTGDQGITFDKVSYYQDYHLVRSFDGTFYSYGFGKLIGKLNENANELIKEIMESAKRHNSNTGIMGSLGSNVDDSITLGQDRITLVETDGATLRDNLVMLPTKEPPSTLFSVLGLLMDKSDRLAGATDLLAGGATGNMPATTAMAVVSQGMSAHSAIHKRIWRAMTGEFNIVFELMKANVKGEAGYSAGQETTKLDLSQLPSGVEITVTADPALTSEMHRAAQANYYAAFMQDPYTNQEELRTRMHSLMRVPDFKNLISPPPPGPTPEQQVAQAELELKREEQFRKATETSFKAKLAAAQISKLLADAVSTITPEDSKQDLGKILEKANSLINLITGEEIAQSNQQNLALGTGGNAGFGQQPPGHGAPMPPGGPAGALPPPSNFGR